MLIIKQPTVIDISTARKQLSTLVNASYMQEKSFIITKRDIPIAKIVPLSKEETMSKKKKTIDMDLFGIWENDTKFIGMSSGKIAKKLRSSGWKRTE